MRPHHVPGHPRPGVPLRAEARRAAAAFAADSAACHKYRASRNERRRSEHPGGKILRQHEQPVALDVIRLQRRRRARRVRVVMLHHGVRHVQALPPRPARAQPEVRVLAIQEEIVVEAADLVRAWRAGKAPPTRSAAGPPRAPGNPPGGRPCPRCLLLPSSATSMPAESSRCSPKSRTCDAHMPASGRRSIAAHQRLHPARDAPRRRRSASRNTARSRRAGPG